MMIEMKTAFFRQLAPSVHGGVDARELSGQGVNPAEIIDFSSNQSPIGASPAVAQAVRRAVLDAYPDRDAFPLARAIAEHHRLDPRQVVVGNGSTELIRLIAQLALIPGQSTLGLAPSFGEYRVGVELAGGVYNEVSISLDGAEIAPAIADELATGAHRILWWCSPNNPTGAAAHPSDIARLIYRFPDVLFVLDEAYCDLLPAPHWTPELLESGNLIILRSMTKAWGLAGLRLGYALASAALMAPLCEAKPPWNVNACAQEAGIAALRDADHYARALELLRREKGVLVSGLSAQGWEIVPSAAAFFLVRVGDGAVARRHLLSHGCLLRDCASFGLPEYIRISPRRPEENQRLLAAFATLLKGASHG